MLTIEIIDVALSLVFVVLGLSQLHSVHLCSGFIDHAVRFSFAALIIIVLFFTAGHIEGDIENPFMFWKSPALAILAFLLFVLVRRHKGDYCHEPETFKHGPN